MRELRFRGELETGIRRGPARRVRPTRTAVDLEAGPARLRKLPAGLARSASSFRKFHPIAEEIAVIAELRNRDRRAP